MQSKDFINWLKGFLTNKEKLNKNDIDTIKEQMEEVEDGSVDLSELNRRDFYPNQHFDWVTPNVNEPLYPSPNSSGCKYPGSCGMPTIWHGITPPICTKCGHGGQMPNITCDNTGNVNFGNTNDTQ